MPEDLGRNWRDEESKLLASSVAFINFGNKTTTRAVKTFRTQSSGFIYIYIYTRDVAKK